MTRLHRMAGFGLAIVLGSALALTAQAPASAAPARSDSQSIPVYFVHGIDPLVLTTPGADCGSTWWNAIAKFRSLGWTGPLNTVAFYTGDTRCGYRIANADRNTPIKELGRKLAWMIYWNDSQYGRYVDLVAHSMGGLILRAALTGTALTPGGGSATGWPPYIYVENAVTISSPHNGTSLAVLCAAWSTQCGDLIPHSSFLQWLIPNVQGAGGTDWTYLGTQDDDIVPVASATTESYAGHYVIYFAGQPMEHTQQTNNVSGTYRRSYWNYNTGPNWTYQAAGPSVIETAKIACYYWRNW